MMFRFSIVDPKFLKANPKRPVHKAGQPIATNVHCKSLKKFSEAICNHGIVISQLKDGVRRTSHFKRCNMVAWDFDDFEHTSEDIHTFLANKGINHSIFGSYSWSETCDKFHLFIPTDNEITNPKLYKFIAKTFSKKWEWKIDQSTTDAIRFFAKHKKLLYSKQDGKNIHTIICNTMMQKSINKIEKMKRLKKKYTQPISDTRYEVLLITAQELCEKPEGKFADGDMYKIIIKLMEAELSEYDILQFIKKTFLPSLYKRG